MTMKPTHVSMIPASPRLTSNSNARSLHFMSFLRYRMGCSIHQRTFGTPHKGENHCGELCVIHLVRLSSPIFTPLCDGHSLLLIGRGWLAVCILQDVCHCFVSRKKTRRATRARTGICLQAFSRYVMGCHRFQKRMSASVANPAKK